MPDAGEGLSVGGGTVKKVVHFFFRFAYIIRGNIYNPIPTNIKNTPKPTNEKPVSDLEIRMNTAPIAMQIPGTLLAIILTLNVLLLCLIEANSISPSNACQGVSK